MVISSGRWLQRYNHTYVRYTLNLLIMRAHITTTESPHLLPTSQPNTDKTLNQPKYRTVRLTKVIDQWPNRSSNFVKSSYTFQWRLWFWTVLFPVWMKRIWFLDIRKWKQDSNSNILSPWPHTNRPINYRCGTRDDKTDSLKIGNRVLKTTLIQPKLIQYFSFRLKTWFLVILSETK